MRIVIDRLNSSFFIFLLSVALLALALFLPARTLVEALLGPNSPRTPYLLTGTLILRFTLAAEAILLLIGVFGRAWFRSAGMPVSATGLTLGPEGWTTVRTQPAWLLLGGLLILAAGLRLIGLNQGLWLDEVVTLVFYARLPFLQNFTAFSSANQHILYSALASLSLSLFGESAWAVRLPATLFGLGGIGVLYYFARVLTSEREALWATALLTVSYHHVWFSQNARGWIGLLFFALLGSGLFLRGLAQNRQRVWLAYALVMALGFFTHLNTLFIFLSHFAAYALVLPRWSGWLARHWPLTHRLIWVGLVIAVLTIQAYSLLLPEIVVYTQTEDRTGLGWTNPFELLQQVARGLELGFLGLGVFGVLTFVGVGFVSYWRQSPLVAGLLVFPAGFNVAALFVLQVGAYPRHFLYTLPLALILAVRGAFVGVAWLADWVPVAPVRMGLRRFGGAVLLGLVILLSLLSLVPYYRVPKQDYRGALAYVEAQRSPSDVVAAVGLAASSYRLLHSPHLEFPETVIELASLRSENHATWVIYTFQRDMRIRFPEIYTYIERDFSLVASFPGTVGDGTIWIARAEGQGKIR